MSKKVTVTVDLDEVRELVRRVSEDNSGLETSSGMTPDDLDRGIEVLVRGPAMRPFLDLLLEIASIHRDAHNEFV